MTRDTAPPVYRFSALTEPDLPLVEGWLREPHVARWWGEPAAEIAAMREGLADTWVERFIVALDGRPIGFIQSYDPFAEPGHPYADQPSGTRGIDQFIGVAGDIGMGHGPRFVAAFCGRLAARGVPRVVTDPHPSNRAAIRAYEKAGFAPLDHRYFDQGPVLLMARDAARDPSAS